MIRFFEKGRYRVYTDTKGINILEITIFDFLALSIIILILIPMRYSFKAYLFTKFEEYLILCCIFVLGWLNMIFHALIIHFDVLLFHKIEYFTFIFMYYLIYLLGFAVFENKKDRKYKLIFSYATIHIIISLLLIINYDAWLSQNNLYINLNGEIYRIGSGIFLIYAFAKIETSVPSLNTSRVTGLWKLAGVFIVLIGIETIITILLLLDDYRMYLVTLSINLLGVLALLLISTVSYIVLKYPTAFIISHDQVFKAINLYEEIGDQYSSPSTMIDYLKILSKEFADQSKFLE